MNSLKKLQIIIPISLSLFFFVSPVLAATPDGLGPWADSVASFHQGVMKNGLPVPAARSNSTAALGVAENTPTVDSTFFSLGFGGDIVLGFDNGISSGALVVEATIEPGYPGEKAKIEMSQDGVNWVMAGTVVQSGTVDKPAGITCAKFVRITDTSIPSVYPDDIADGYDVDGVKATGDLCNPNPSISPTPTLSPSPTSAPTPTQTPSSGGVASAKSTTTSNSPGFPNTGSCTATGVTITPNIILAKRLSPTSIFVSWGQNAEFNNFIVQYGFQNGNWQFNTKVSGFSTTINNLPSNQSIWVRVAALDNCGGIGTFGGSVLVGGTALTNSPGFPNTGNSLIPGFPNTGNPLIPSFPNTGFAPHESNIFLSIRNDIQFIFSTFFKALHNTF